MTSSRQLEANRNNAKASTGPKSNSGKFRSAQNARRHGLSLSVLTDPARSKEVEAVAREIAGDNAGPEIYALARRIAEAQLDLVRVRQARHEYLTRNLNDSSYRPQTPSKETIKILKQTFKLTDKGLPITAEMMDFIGPIAEGPGKFAAILSELAKRLAGLERYERRALSRRKFAIRALDAVRQEAHVQGSH